MSLLSTRPATELRPLACASVQRRAAISLWLLHRPPHGIEWRPLAASIIYSLDIAGPVGVGATGALWGTLGCIVKTNNAGAPHLVANEFVCGRLAAVLGLPVPPVLVADTPHGVACMMLRFGKGGEKPPPADAQALTNDHPDLAAGVLAFDAWIANNDRHPSNFAYAPNLIAPVIFDHGQALLGCNDKGLERLKNIVSKPCASGPIALFMKRADLLAKWIERIEQLPEYFIGDVCNEAVNLKCLKSGESSELKTFLLERRANLKALLKQACSKMTELTHELA